MSKWVEQFNGRMDGWGRKLHEKEIRIPVDLVTGILFFALALIILLVMPDQVAISEKDVVNGRAFPTLLMVLMMLCCAMLVGKELYKLATKQPLNWKVINVQVEMKALVILAILVVTWLLSRLTGLFVVGAQSSAAWVFCSTFGAGRNPTMSLPWSWRWPSGPPSASPWAWTFKEGNGLCYSISFRPPACCLRWKTSCGSISACSSARSLRPSPV